LIAYATVLVTAVAHLLCKSPFRYIVSDISRDCYPWPGSQAARRLKLLQCWVALFCGRLSVYREHSVLPRRHVPRRKQTNGNRRPEWQNVWTITLYRMNIDDSDALQLISYQTLLRHPWKSYWTRHYLTSTTIIFKFKFLFHF